MRLQRLTNLEILTLRKEYAELEKRIAHLKGILASEKKLMNVIKRSLSRSAKVRRRAPHQTGGFL